MRVSYTGELGYELYCPAGYQRGLFDLLREEGRDLDLRLAGSRALMSLRLEKSFPGWGLELGSDYSAFEPGLGRFVRLDKDDFIGKAASQAISEKGPAERIATFVVDARDADAFGGEAVYRNGELAGYITSGGYGHCAGESLAMGYVRSEHYEPGAEYELDILGEQPPGAPVPRRAYRSRRFENAELEFNRRAKKAGQELSVKGPSRNRPFHAIVA